MCFYDRDTYLYSSYGGRRWGSHSGSDSDDKYFFIGYTKDELSILSSYNIERRGITSRLFPETKNEIIIRLMKRNNNFNYSLYLEKEKIKNYNFNPNRNIKESNVIGFGIYWRLQY